MKQTGHCLRPHQSSRQFYVYELYVEGETQPFYVGKTYVGSKRVNAHITNSKFGSTLRDTKIIHALHNKKEIIEKVVEYFDNESDAFSKERELITFYGRKDLGSGVLCNHTDGGEGSCGTVRSAKQASAVSEANKRRIVTEYMKAKISAGNRGKVRSQEVKDRISTTKSIPIFVFTATGDIVGIFGNLDQAQLMLGINRTTIHKYIKRGHGQGMTFKVPSNPKNWLNKIKELNMTPLDFVISRLEINEADRQFEEAREI